MLLKKNNAKTTINQIGGIGTGNLTITVADASQLPISGDFLVTIWNKATYPDPTDDANQEILKVTGVSGNVLTVERGQEDTVAHIHANGHAVEMLITAGIFQEIEDSIGTGGVTEGDGIDIVAGEVSVKVDNDSIVINGDGNLEASKSHEQNTDTILDDGGINEISASEIKEHIDDVITNPHNVEADQIPTNESGKTVQDKIDEADSHIADISNPHEVTIAQVINTLFGQDLNGNLQPMEDYFGQGGFFERDENFNRQPKTSLIGLTDFFFELDEQGDIMPKANV